MRDFLTRLPKAELHLHIEGSLEPELMFALAERNGVALPYATVEEVRAAYDFSDLQSFLDLYYQGMSVLHTAQDFHDLAMDYFRRAHAEGVVHVEMHFDPQAHLARGIELQVVVEGLSLARREAARELGLSTALIMAFLRDRDAEEAMKVLEAAAPYWEMLDAVGLDSAERGNPGEVRRGVRACPVPGHPAGGPRRRGGAAGLYPRGAGPPRRVSHRSRGALPGGSRAGRPAA